MEQPASKSAYAEPVKIVIEPFEDSRLDKGRIGKREHLWGGVTYYDVGGERPGDVTTEALASRLKARGWGDRAWNVQAASAESATDADIVISGQVRDFSANANSGVFYTDMTTTVRFTLQARNLMDKSTTTRNIESIQNKGIFWFDEEHLQDLLAATLNDGIDRLISDTMIEQKALRPVVR